MQECLLELSKLVEYRDGKIYWLPRPESMFPRKNNADSWNTRFSGKEAGWMREDGYVSIRYKDRRFFAHRLVWAIHHGGLDDSIQIDHRDRDPSNNRIGNLRVATQQQNNFNQAVRVNNTSGVKGISWHEYYRMWRATVRGGGKRYEKRSHNKDDLVLWLAEMRSKLHAEFSRA